MKRTFAFILGAGIGGVLSSLLVLLLTPYKGDELRALAHQSFDRIQNEVKRASAEKRLELELELSRLRKM